MNRGKDKFYRKKVSQTLFEAFNNATSGLLEIFYQERNMRIHLFFAFSAVLLSIFLKLDINSFLWVGSAIALVFTAEAFNTVIESLVDMIAMRELPQAKIVKDMSAGAVLISVIYSIIVGYLVLLPRVKEVIKPLLSEVISQPKYIGILVIIITIFTVIYLKVKLSNEEEWEPLKGGAISGHAAIAFAIATYLSLVTLDFKVIVATFFLAIMIAQSRIEGKIHTPKEVIAGASTGTIIALLSLMLLKLLK